MNAVAALQSGWNRTMAASIHFWVNEQDQEMMSLKFTTRGGTNNNTVLDEAWFKVVRENDIISFHDLVQSNTVRGTNIANHCSNIYVRALVTYFFCSGENNNETTFTYTTSSTDPVTGVVTTVTHTNTLTASGNKFKVDWAPNNTPELPDNLGALYLVDDNGNPTGSYVPGIMGNVAP
jgi:hypothetical protein